MLTKLTALIYRAGGVLHNNWGGAAYQYSLEQLWNKLYFPELSDDLESAEKFKGVWKMRRGARACGFKCEEAFLGVRTRL